ncbi:hypothetical protein [Paracoccus endophyticus]|uniref:hypothetical protein n=1 Tax=Paracoccus endophyticus TaxID=2233774 RepID=UPI00197CB5E9|nr:hypothetical protein [Paracoccus endophyticus]
MGNWIPDDPTMPAQILRLAAEYGPPPPPGLVSPSLWGTGQAVVERFGQAGIPAGAIATRPAVFDFHLDRPPSSLTDIFVSSFGPIMRVFEALGPGPRADALRARMDALLEQENLAQDGTTHIRARYLMVTVTVTDAP